jgi:hypothetical protein
MLSVLVPATSSRLTSLDAVKRELSISGTSDDARLLAYIDQASAVIADYLGRPLGRETVAETLRLSASSEVIMLSRWPVVSVTSVVEDGVTLAATDYEIDRSFIYRLLSDERARWPAAKIVITYVAGYDLPSGVPSAIERAATQLVVAMNASRGRDPALRSESVEGIGSQSWLDPRNGGGPLPDGVVALLNPYREVIV